LIYFVTDIRLDWRTYNYPTPTCKKLISVNVWFGDAFPLQKQMKTKIKSSQNLITNSTVKV